MEVGDKMQVFDAVFLREKAEQAGIAPPYPNGAVVTVESITGVQGQTRYHFSWGGRRWAVSPQNVRRLSSGTAPNTSIVLTDTELTFCEANGGKSATIHEALRRMMAQ